MFAQIKTFLGRHPKIKYAIRELRWQIKRVPLIGWFSIAFDAAYFRNAGTERPEADVHGGADEYSEANAKFLVPRARGRVLDIGCGRGYLTRRVAENPAVKEVVGIDKIDEFVSQHPKIKYISEDLPPRGDFPGKFDTIVASEFVEHISEKAHREILAKVARALAPGTSGGIYLGSTPHNPTNFKTFSGSRWHVREYNERDLENVLREFFSRVTITALPEHCLVWEASGPKN